MAVRTIQARMSADERKAIVVLLHCLQDDVPSFHRVALLAVRAHLPAMNVRMAIGAMCSCVDEDRFRVTLGTTHADVKSTQGVFCFVVVEFWIGANGLPSHRRVAVLARNREITMRTAGHGLVRLPPRRQGRQCAK